MTVKNSFIDVAAVETLRKYGIQRVAVAIGVFDGVHRGHQFLLKELIQMAKTQDAWPVVITFYPHPREILNPDEPPLLLVSQEKKLSLFHSFGIKAVVTIPFSKEFATLSAEEFLTDCLHSPHVKICGVCVGKDWSFGAGGKGNIETIDNFSKKKNFVFKAVEEVCLDRKIISSTAIRRAVTGGLLEEARSMLGRPYSVIGKVEHGEMIGASLLGCPTANISVAHGILPPCGVYAGLAVYRREKYPAAIAIGTAPTFSHKIQCHPSIEAHLLDFSGDVYGETLEIEFVKYFREERCYPSPETLRIQIKDDLKSIREILESYQK